MDPIDLSVMESGGDGHSEQLNERSRRTSRVAPVLLVILAIFGCALMLACSLAVEPLAALKEVVESKNVAHPYTLFAVTADADFSLKPARALQAIPTPVTEEMSLSLAPARRLVDTTVAPPACLPEAGLKGDKDPCAVGAAFSQLASTAGGLLGMLLLGQVPQWSDVWKLAEAGVQTGVSLLFGWIEAAFGATMEAVTQWFAPLLSIAGSLISGILSAIFKFFGGLFFKKPTMYDVAQEVLYKARNYTDKKIIAAQMTNSKGTIISIHRELEWVPGLLGHISSPKISAETVEMSYFLNLQHDLATMKSSIFGYDCIQEMEALDYSLPSNQTENEKCKQWQKAGTLQIGLWFAELHIILLGQILNLDPGVKETVVEQIKEAGYEYACLLRSSYKTFKQHRLEQILLAEREGTLRGGEDKFFVDEKCKGNCHEVTTFEDESSLGRQYRGCEGQCDIFMHYQAQACEDLRQSDRRRTQFDRRRKKSSKYDADRCVQAYRDDINAGLENEFLSKIAAFEELVLVAHMNASEIHVYLEGKNITW